MEGGTYWLTIIPKRFVGTTREKRQIFFALLEGLRSARETMPSRQLFHTNRIEVGVTKCEQGRSEGKSAENWWKPGHKRASSSYLITRAKTRPLLVGLCVSSTRADPRMLNRIMTEPFHLFVPRVSNVSSGCERTNWVTIIDRMRHCVPPRKLAVSDPFSCLRVSMRVKVFYGTFVMRYCKFKFSSPPFRMNDKQAKFGSSHLQCSSRRSESFYRCTTPLINPNKGGTFIVSTSPSGAVHEG